MWVCDALKSLIICLKTLSVLGSSPPPRQQNHLSVTGGPVKVCDGTGVCDNAGDGSADGAPPNADALLPQALTSAPTRPRWPPTGSVGSCSPPCQVALT